MDEEKKYQEDNSRAPLAGRRYLSAEMLARQKGQVAPRAVETEAVPTEAPDAPQGEQERAMPPSVVEASESSASQVDRKRETSKINVAKLRTERAQNTATKSDQPAETMESPAEPPVEKKYLRGMKAVDFGSAPTAEVIAVMKQVAETGDYELLDVQAKGAESILYRARYYEYEFCVKAIRNRLDEWLGNPNTRGNTEKLQNTAYKTKCRHLLNEYQIGQRLGGSGTELPIVKIFGLHKVKRFGLELGYDLLMEFVSGHDLSEKQVIKSLTLEDKVKVMFRATQALEYLHRRKIIHLDIKPSNFMLGRDGRVRLLDFGVSVTCGYRPTTISGTMGFLSPEQICKDYLNESTDIFALGITFAVLFGGKAMVQSHEEMLQKNVRRQAKNNLENSQMPAVSDVPELVSMPALADVIRKCTIFQRESRTQSCQSLLSQLRAAAKQYAIDLT
ncbi:MAG: protein kinase [Victivallales bacterium]|nr:protein kinase [Victivallales bacterium]